MGIYMYVQTIPDGKVNESVLGRRVYEFNADGRMDRMYWIRGGRRAMPERPRAAFAVSQNEVYLLGVRIKYQLSRYMESQAITVKIKRIVD